MVRQPVGAPLRIMLSQALQEAVEVNGVVGTAGLFPAKGFSAGVTLLDLLTCMSV